MGHPQRVDMRGNNMSFGRVLLNAGTPTSVNTAGNVTYSAAQMLSGIIVRDPNGGARSDALDTAANILAAAPYLEVGDVFSFLLINGADAAETITFANGTGGSFDANHGQARTLTQNQTKLFMIRITSATTYVTYY